jgi:hypothetical protein
MQRTEIEYLYSFEDGFDGVPDVRRRTSRADFFELDPSVSGMTGLGLSRSDE